jgi:hypothetical protein
MVTLHVSRTAIISEINRRDAVIVWTAQQILHGPQTGFAIAVLRAVDDLVVRFGLDYYAAGDP